MGEGPDAGPGGLAGLEAENERLRAEVGELQAQQARLRESERMYRFSAEIARRLVWATDPEGKVLAMSRMFSVLTGVSDDLALKDGWLEVVHPDDRARIGERWRQCLASGEYFQADFRGLLPNGLSRHVQSRAVPVRDKAGAITCWYGSTIDMQEERDAEQARREAEERLRESEELYRYTVELSQQLAWTATPKGRLLTLSPRFYTLTGISPEIAPNDAWQQAVHPDDAEAVQLEWRGAMEDGRPHSSEFRVRLADGSYRLYRVRAAPRRDEEGRIVRWYGTTEDIHEQRAADLARMEAEQRYRLAVRATNDAIWDYDIESGIVDWSEMASGIVGSDRPLGTTPIGWWEERVHPNDMFRVIGSLQRALDGDQSRWSEAYRFLRDDGSYADILDRGFIIRDPAGKAVRAVGAMADLTERHRAEAELSRMQAELVHFSRVSAMGTMASTLAHELNQPLTAVANYVRGARRMVERDFAGSGADLAEVLAAAEAGALRAGQIVRRLRELVSRGRVSTGVEDVERMIEEAGTLAFVDEQLHGITHRVEVDPAARRVRADRIQVQQVLINLIRNAVQAMQNCPVREIVISAAPAEGDMVELRVADTGQGVAAHHMDTLFSHFMTTKKGGMGIGLPISRTIVEAHGGKIWAERREGGGAVFCFTLPRAKAGGAKLPAAYIPAQPSYLRPEEGEEKVDG